MNLLRHLRIPSVLGSHEHGLVEARARGWFSPQARKALDRTRALLSDDTLMCPHPAAHHREERRCSCTAARRARSPSTSTN